MGKTGMKTCNETWWIDDVRNVVDEEICLYRGEVSWKTMKKLLRVHSGLVFSSTHH